MRFIGLREFNGALAPEKVAEINEERKKYPNRYPKKLRFEDGTIAESWIGDGYKGFTIYETDDPQQLENLAKRWMPEMKWTFLPLLTKPHT